MIAEPSALDPSVILGATEERRRDELADFLRKRRAHLKPEEVGLPSGGRRRTPGLRREEVAHLAGVGTTWYTWLEQGREVRASLDVLEAISRALRLTPAERTHLVLLGRGEVPPPCKSDERVSPTVKRLIENLGPNPAYVIGRRWDYLAWNRAACALLGDFDAPVVIDRPRASHNRRTRPVIAFEVRGYRPPVEAIDPFARAEDRPADRLLRPCGLGE